LRKARQVNIDYKLELSENYTQDFCNGAYIVGYGLELHAVVQLYKCFVVLFITDDIAERDRKKLAECIVFNDLKKLSVKVGELYEDVVKELHPRLRASFRSHTFVWLLGVMNWHLVCENGDEINTCGLFPLRSTHGFWFISMLVNWYPNQFETWMESMTFIDFAEKQAFIVMGFNDLVSSRKEIFLKENVDNLVLNMEKSKVNGRREMLEMLIRYRTRKEVLCESLKKQGMALPPAVEQYDIRLCYWQNVAKRYTEILPLLGEHNCK